MKLGANSVLFGGFDMETAFKYIAMAGYDGIELAAMGRMAPQHLDLERWPEQVAEIKRLSQEYGLALQAIEQPRQDFELMEKAFQAAVELGVPNVNCCPIGKADEGEEGLARLIDSLGKLSQMAERYGVTLCVKAHVGASMHDTPTTLRVMKAITSPAFGIDMDPSHIHRSGENPVEAIAQVVSRVKHVHIRDCKGRGPRPGAPADQANGRGDVDLIGYIRVLHESGYEGPVDLEVIGAWEYDLEHCCVIAAEARGHMQACLQACGAR